MVDLTTRKPGEEDTDKKCPLLENPQPDCYCLKLNSMSVPKAIHFCLRDFRECPIYRRFVEIIDF